VDAHPGWARLLTDLATQYARQRPITQNPAARFAGRPLRRHSQLTFQRCLFPGCRRRASDCDLDHRRDHAHGGRTEHANLAPACRHDHMNKTKRNWRLVRINEHTHCWISPLGRRHIVHIDPVAAPLPAPMPRPLGRDIPPSNSDNSEPSFHARTRRGRPLTRPHQPAADSDRDDEPPPF
jgi:hypothetical protein